MSRLSCAWRRWYSLRSGRWARFRSYSRRSCFGASGSSGLGVVGFLVALFGLAGRGFFPVLFVAFGPRRVFLGSAKVCSSVILLEYCAGSGSGIGYDEGGDSGRFCLGGLPQFPASSGKYEGSIPARSGSVVLQGRKRQCLTPRRGGLQGVGLEISCSGRFILGLDWVGLHWFGGSGEETCCIRPITARHCSTHQGRSSWVRLRYGILRRILCIPESPSSPAIALACLWMNLSMPPVTDLLLNSLSSSSARILAIALFHGGIAD